MKSSILVTTGLMSVVGFSLLQPSGLRAQDAVAKPEEKPKWKQSAGLGFSLTSGNADTLLFTANYEASRKWQKNEVGLGIRGGYGENEGEVNNEFVRAHGQYNRLFGTDDRWYAFGRVEYQYDGIADIDYRVPVSLGLGYYFLKEGVNGNDKFNLSAEIGPGYVFEKLGGITHDYMTIYFGERFTWKISENANLWQSVDYTPQVDDFGNSVTNFELGVESKLRENLSIRATFSDTYRTEPAAGREENDLRFITSLAYTF